MRFGEWLIWGGSPLGLERNDLVRRPEEPRAKALAAFVPLFAGLKHCKAESLAGELGGLRQGQVQRDYTDLATNGFLILREAFEHEDAAVDVDGHAIALPVLFVYLLALQAEMTTFIDVSEHAEAELDGTDDFGVEGAKSVFGFLDGDGAYHLVSDAFLVGGWTKFGLGLEGEAETSVDFAIGS